MHSYPIDAANYLLSDLRSRGSRLIPLITTLREGPWADPAARLKAATEAEPILKKELAWLEAGGEVQADKTEELAGGLQAEGI